MKTIITFALALAFLGILGCSLGSSGERGGSMQGGEGFSITVPAFTTKIVQGEVQNVPLSISRGKFFKRDVTLDLRSSKGIRVEPTNLVIQASDVPEVSVRIIASRDAAIGEYRIYVKGTPETGQPTTAEFAVKVVAP